MTTDADGWKNELQDTAIPGFATRLTNTGTGEKQIRVYRLGTCIGWVNVGVFFYSYKADSWQTTPLRFDSLDEAIHYLAASHG